MSFENITLARSWPKGCSHWSRIVVIAAMALVLAPPERAHGQSNLVLAAGAVGDTHHALGVGLMSLVKVTLLHDRGIDLSLLEEAVSTRRAELVQVGVADLALLAESDSALYASSGRIGVVSQFTLEGEGGATKETINLVANSDLDATLIENLTSAIVEEERWLSGALPGLTRLAPDQPESAGISWHKGALAHYQTLYPGIGSDPRTLSGTPDIFLIYLDDGGGTLNDEAKRQIGLACNHAIGQGTTSVIVNGSADVMSLDPSGLRFSDAKAQAALDQLRSHDGCSNAVIEQEPDSRTLTERHDPDVPVTVGRRLEVGVILNR